MISVRQINQVSETEMERKRETFRSENVPGISEHEI